MIKIDKNGNPYIEAEALVPYETAVGPTWHRFFEGFKEEKLFGTRCPKCNRVLVPARAFCPRCFADMEEWVELPQEGSVKTWALVDYEYFGMPTEAPFIFAVIELQGADCGFIHLIGGIDMSDLGTVRTRLKSGVRVKAVWNEKKTGNIMDIKYFEPTTSPIEEGKR